MCASSKETGKEQFQFVYLHKAALDEQSFSQEQSDSYGFQILKYSPFSEWLQSVQVLMVLSVVFSSVSFLVFLGQLFTMSKGGLFYFTGLCQVFAGNSGV